MAIPEHRPSADQIQAEREQNARFRVQNTKGAWTWAGRCTYVVPTVPDDKKSYVEWDQATNSPDEAVRQFNSYANALVGVLTGRSKLMALDFDKKRGGVQSYERMKEMYPDILDTYTETTKSGGYHVVFSSKALESRGLGVGNAACSDTKNVFKDFPGVDVRGVGGFLVVAPSISVTGEYKTLIDKPFAEVPMWAEKLCSDAGILIDPTKVDDRPVTILSEPVDMSKYPSCIKNLIGILEYGKPSHDQRVALGSFLIGVGNTIEQCLSVFSRAQSYNEKLTRQQLDSLAKDPYNYKCSTIASWGDICPDAHRCGAGTPYYVYKRLVEPWPEVVVEGEGIEGALVRKPKENGTTFMYTPIESPKWAVPGWVRHCAKLIIAGEEKVGKSKLAAILTLSYITGRDFLNRSDCPMEQQGRVMYVDGENSDTDIKINMIQAGLAIGAITSKDVLDESHLVPGCTMLDNVYIYTPKDEIKFDVNDTESMDYIEQEIARLKPVMVIFDLFYTFFDGNGNREEEITPFVNRFSRWIAKYNTGVCVCLHFNKGSTSGSYTSEISTKRISGSNIWGKWYSSALLCGNPCAKKEVAAEEDDNGDLLINTPTGTMNMVIQRHFRGAPRFSDVYMTLNITATACNVSLGRKPEGATGKKLTHEQLKATVIRYMQERPVGDEMTCTNLDKGIRAEYKNAGIVRDDLRITIKRMCEDSDLVPGNKTDNVRLAEQHVLKGDFSDKV